MLVENKLTRKIAEKQNNKHQRKIEMKNILITSLTAVALLAATSAFADHMHKSSKFEGAKANTGTVTHTVKDGKNILTLSDDFKVPETPDPHWQVVDSKGNV